MIFARFSKVLFYNLFQWLFWGGGRRVWSSLGVERECAWEGIFQKWSDWGYWRCAWDRSRACVCCWCGVVVGGNLFVKCFFITCFSGFFGGEEGGCGRVWVWKGSVHGRAFFRSGVIGDIGGVRGIEVGHVCAVGVEWL